MSNPEFPNQDELLQNAVLELNAIIEEFQISPEFFDIGRELATPSIDRVQTLFRQGYLGECSFSSDLYNFQPIAQQDEFGRVEAELELEGGFTVDIGLLADHDDQIVVAAVGRKPHAFQSAEGLVHGTLVFQLENLRMSADEC